MRIHPRLWALPVPLILLGACAANPSPDLPMVAQATLDANGAQSVSIVGGSYYFRPARVTVKAGTPVVLSVSKAPGIIPHRFVIDAPEAGMDVAVSLSTEAETVRFTPTRPGEYEYYCDKSGLFGNHRRKGMEGVLEVIP